MQNIAIQPPYWYNTGHEKTRSGHLFVMGKKMNKEQWICLVAGLSGIFIPVGQDFWQFGIWVIAVLIITGVLIYRYRDKPKDKEKEGTE